MTISPHEVSAARGRIAGHVRRTPVVPVDPGGFGTAATVWLKCEFMQHTGSFKARGAFNRILAARERGELGVAGVTVASGGNAGMAVAYAAASLSIPAAVYLPETAPAVKVAKLATFGAEVHQVGSEYAHAYAAATKAATDTGALFCHAYDQPEICAGQATVATELLEQVPDVDTVLVAVGGGGLMAGIAAGLERRAAVVAVEPRAIATLHTALARREPVDVPVSGVAADSLGARRIGRIAFETATEHDVRSIMVGEADIVAARSRLWQEYRLAVEHAAATAMAALTGGAYRPAAGERVAIILCGANTDTADLAA